MDETLGALGPVDADNVSKYRHVLKSRNGILKSWEEYGAGLTDAVEPWNQALVSAGAKIIASRVEMLKTMAEREISERRRKALDSAFGGEKIERSTKVGPHRDDVEISIGGRESRFTASQGEQRTLAFCMRLAQKENIERATG